MSTAEQSDLSRQLQARMQRPWAELTAAEKQAAYFIAFGNYGPRATLHPPGFQTQVFLKVTGLIGVAAAIFLLIRSFAPPPPHTMTKEWQEATNERMKEQKAEPISGGNWVQSK